MNFESTELMCGLYTGDERAFQFIYKKYYDEIVFYAWKIVHHTHQAEDMASDSFIKLWDLHSSFDSEQHIRSFLYATTRNACYNYLKHTKRLIRRELEFFNLFGDHKPMAEHNIPQLSMKEISTEIRKLPLQQRLVCTLLFLRCQSVDLVAKKLKLSRQTVRNHKTRALRNLRANLTCT